MTKSRRYAPEYRRQMVELLRTGRTPEELSREFECLAQGDPATGCARRTLTSAAGRTV